MIVQSTSASFFAAEIARSSSPRQNPSAPATNFADKIRISQAARDLAAQESKSASPDSNAPHAADQRFPPPSAPAEIRMAWSAATRGMSDMDRLVAEGAFMAEDISANLKYDSAGRAIGIRQRGEPSYVDLWNQPNVSYPEQVDRMLEKLERNKFAYTPKDYSFFHDMLTGFQTALSNDGAPKN